MPLSACSPAEGNGLMQSKGTSHQSPPAEHERNIESFHQIGVAASRTFVRCTLAYSWSAYGRCKSQQAKGNPGFKFSHSSTFPQLRFFEACYLSANSDRALSDAFYILNTLLHNFLKNPFSLPLHHPFFPPGGEQLNLSHSGQSG